MLKHSTNVKHITNSEKPLYSDLCRVNILGGRLLRIFGISSGTHFAKNSVYSGLSSKCTRTLTFCISLCSPREDAAALARVNDLIRRHGVGAGPTWDGHAGGEEAEDGTITLTFSGLSNFLVGVALGGLLAGVIFRR